MVSASKLTGIRIVHFKDLILDNHSRSAPYRHWEEHGTMGSTELTEVTTKPSSDISKFGNRIKISPAVGTGISILKSKTAGTWANTSQSPTGDRNGVMYSAAMSVEVGGQGIFMFFWDPTGNTSYGIRLVAGTGIDLMKCSGDPTSQVNWTAVANVSTTCVAATTYWINILYYPEEVNINGIDVGIEGDLTVWVDDDWLERGLGNVGMLEYTDSTPLTTGTLLGLAHYEGTGYVTFDQIVFADAFQAGLQAWYSRQSIFIKGHGLLRARFSYATDFFVMSKNQRVELWLNNWDEDANNYRICEFDGVIKRIEERQRERLAIITAVTEDYELAFYRSQEGFVAGQSYYDWIVTNYTTEDVPFITIVGRIALSMFEQLGSGLDDVDVSANWTYGGDDYQMFKRLSWICNTIIGMTPEGFLIASKTGFKAGTAHHFDKDNSTSPQPILWHHVNEDLVNYYNSVNVLDKDQTDNSANDTPLQATDGVVEKEMFEGYVPGTEAGLIAANILLQYKDKNPFIELVTFSYKSELFPGCVVYFSSDKDGLDTVPMIVIEKITSDGTWGEETREFPAGSVFFRLAYFDHAGGRLPRLYYGTSDEMVKRDLEDMAAERENYYGASSGGGGGVTDHGALTGLGDDDHTQYHNNTRGDARYSQLGHNHDSSYYTETETDAFFNATSGHDHDGTDSKKVDHANLENKGTNTHSTIDTHLGSTSNPHSVTGDQALPSQTGNNGKFLTTDGTNCSWGTGGGGGDADAIHDNVAAEINVITQKTAPTESDVMLIEDAADSYNKKKIIIANIPASKKHLSQCLFTSSEPIITGDGEVGLPIPFELNGYDLVDVIAVVVTAGSGTGTTDIQVRRRRSGTNSDMLSTKVTIGTGEYFARDGTIDTTLDDVSTGDMIFIDVDAKTSTAPYGLSVCLTFKKVS